MSAAEAAARERIRAAGGSVAFEEWMRFALYDPEHGYYSRQVRTVGREGDFSTSATMHPALGEAVAAWARCHRRDATGGGHWHLVELGGGTGEMAAQVIDSLGWLARWGLHYHLVEVSTGLRAAQRERLASRAGKISWHDNLLDALEEADGAALIFSNEFVDAFPCARWTLGEHGDWREVRVIWPDGDALPSEIEGAAIPTAKLVCTSLVDREVIARMMPGQRVEVFRSYHGWQREQFGRWRRGRLLTIDYGDEAGALYHRRPGGTLRAYCRQTRFTGKEIYARVGQQDLTADVNFTDLRRWGEEIGLVTASYGTQGDFLRRWLPPSALRRTDDAKLAYMLDQSGPGGAFKVLEQARGA